MSKSKGDRYERRFVNYFDRAGYAVMRAPSSGSATTRDLPDVLAGGQPTDRDDVETIAAEVKYDGDGDDIVYLDAEEVEALKRFASIFDATPVIVVRRWRDAAFYVFLLDSIERTDDGDGENYRVTPEMDDDADAVLSDGDHDKIGSGHGTHPNAVERVGVFLDE